MSKQSTSQLLTGLGIPKERLTRYSLFEPFNRKPNLNGDLASGTEATREPSNPDFEILGANAASSCTAFSGGGGVKLTTTTSASDAVVVLPHLDTAQSGWAGVTWGTEDETNWGTAVATDTSIADIVIWAGLKLTNTSTTATDDNQAFFRFAPATNGGRFQAVYSVSGTDYELDTGVTVAASTAYTFQIILGADRKPSFFINGEQVAKGQNAMTTGIDLIPYVGVLTSTTAAKSIHLRWEAISKLYQN